MARKLVMSALSASSMPMLPSGSSNCSPAAAKSYTAMPRSILPCTCRGAGRPSLACWAAMPLRIGVRSTGG
eukprot:14286549-Alexandrium_andersonii.AAC.1